MKKFIFISLFVCQTAYADWQNPKFRWDSKKNFTNKTTVTIRHVDDPQAVCEVESKKLGNGGFGGLPMEACSFWEGNRCTIILPKKFTIDHLGHEMLHCIQGNYHN